MPEAAAGPRLWLVRHAQPQVAAGTCYGRLDVPAQARATADCAQRLAAALPPRLLLRHSPLQRCAQLAQALQGLRPGLAAQADARLVEMDFGTWEGRAWSAIARADIDAWTADFTHYRPGGGECLAQMLARVHHALQEARHLARTQRCDVLWISHAGVARCLQWLQQAAPGPGAPVRADQWPRQAPAPGQWTCLPLT